MILFDFGFFVVLVIAVMIPLGLGFRIGYHYGKKDTIEYIKTKSQKL